MTGRRFAVAGVGWHQERSAAMRLQLGIIVFVVASLVSWAAQGDDKKPGDAAKNPAELQKQLLEKFDTNKDGVLSDAEKLAAAEAMREKGVLPGSGVGPPSEEFLKKFDRNGDGKLSNEEKLAAQSAWQKMRAGGGRGPAAGGNLGHVPMDLGVPATTESGDKATKKVNPLIKRYDKDGDGKLNDEEKAALQADRKKEKDKEPQEKPAEKPQDKPQEKPQDKP
jgi:EF hand domain-containing protein